MNRTTLLACVLITLLVRVPAFAQQGAGSETYGRLRTEAVSLSRLRSLHGALRAFSEQTGRMPADAGELVAGGYLDDQAVLFDARVPLLVKDPFGQRPRSPEIATFRFVQAWRDGPIATSDLPRRGAWLILTGAGEAYSQPVDPSWLGSYLPQALDDAERDSRIDLSSARLGAYVGDGETDSGRRGVGVDALIPGYFRHGIAKPMTAIGGQIDLRPGDLIVTCNGMRVESVAELEAQIGDGRFSINQRPYLEVIRHGELVFVEPLFAHRMISADTPRERRAAAEALLAANDPAQARDVDLVLLGLLDLAALQAREGAADRLRPLLWIRAWEHAEGRESALAEIDAWLVRPGVSDDQKQELLLLRTEQLRLMGRFDRAIGTIEGLERDALTTINESLRLVEPGDREAETRYRFGGMQAIWTAKLVTLAGAGRVANSIDVAREIMDSPIDRDKLNELLGDYADYLFTAGYPRAGLRVMRDAAPFYEEEEGFADALVMLEEYVGSIEREVGD